LVLEVKPTQIVELSDLGYLGLMAR
jgi:hypothetical protein